MVKIIHVDDSKFALKTTRHHLNMVFGECEIFSHTNEEFQVLIKKGEEFADIDILVTDLMMPDISGHDILKYVRNSNKSIFLVVLTSNVQNTEKKLTFENGCDYFIEKPSTIGKFIKMEEAFYEHRRV